VPFQGTLPQIGGHGKLPVGQGMVGEEVDRFAGGLLRYWARPCLVAPRVEVPFHRVQGGVTKRPDDG
jgi:hypothetical protein